MRSSVMKKTPVSSAKKAPARKAANQSARKESATFIGADIEWRKVKGKGRGVFALRDIKKGTMVEKSPAIPVAYDDVPEGDAPDGYLLDWDPDTKGQEHVMVLGYIMLYNHSSKPTLYLENDYDNMTIASFAARDIKAGEELTWDYNCEIWFDEE